MECEEVLIRLWEYLDQELGPEEARCVSEHLHVCPGCRPACQFERAFLHLLGRQRSCAAPESLALWMRTGFRTQG